MSERLYYRDSFLREFDALVVSCEPSQADSPEGVSPLWWVTLEQTAFYPLSGGQPHDTGRLGDAEVLDVFEREDGAVVHVTDRPVAPGPVRGSVDWSRRFDHMQQHTASHVLAAAFHALFDIPSVSFHIGKAVSTIDVATSSLSSEQAEVVEQYVNRVISEDRPVQVRFGTAADLASLGVRKESEREGLLRAVEIQGINIQACGGTHVCRTSQLGMVLIRGFKRVRENWRVEFVCGERARRAARSDFALLDDIAQRLTCAPESIHAAITRILNERNAANRFGQRHLREASALQAQMLLAKEHAQHSSRSPRTVIGVLPDADMEYLRSVATQIIAEPETIALLGSESNGFLVIAKSDSVPGDVTALLRESVEPCGGKGGGSKDFAQGSVPQRTDLKPILRYAAERAAKAAPALRVVGKAPASARPQSELWQFKERLRG